MPSKRSRGNPASSKGPTTKEVDTRTAGPPASPLPAPDVIAYVGSITRLGYLALTDALEARASKTDAVYLLLATMGGDPDAGFRISRALRHSYKSFTCVVGGPCKSAGTLVALGADRLEIADRGELGPLDIQLSKPDEMFENMSGLDIIQALTMLETRALSAFRNCLLDIRGGSRVRTRLAAELAVQFSHAVVGPIAAKIDPMMLGDHQRKITIAMEYGERLNKHSENLKDGALLRLVSAFPSHGFVIDRREARSLFKRVDPPSAPVRELLKTYNALLQHPTAAESHVVGYLDDPPEQAQGGNAS